MTEAEKLENHLQRIEEQLRKSAKKMAEMLKQMALLQETFAKLNEVETAKVGEWLPIAEFAKRKRVSVQTVRQYFKMGYCSPDMRRQVGRKIEVWYKYDTAPEKAR